MRKFIVIAAALAMGGCTGMHVEPMLKASHVSDITRGYPEPTTDYVGAGATVHWRQVEVDISHGVRSRDCGAMYGGECAWQSGSEVSMRFYPMRNR